MNGESYYPSRINHNHSINFGITIVAYCLIQFFSVFSRMDYLVVEMAFCMVFLYGCYKRVPIYVAISAFMFFVQLIEYIYDYSNNTNEIMFYSPLNIVVKFFGLFIVTLIVTNMKYLNNKMKNTVIIVTFISSILTDIISFYYLKDDLYAIRYRAKFSDTILNGETYYGIITFAEVFAFTLLIYFLFAVIKDYRFKHLSIRVKIILVIALIGNVLMLIFSQLATPIGLFCFNFVLMLAIGNHGWKRAIWIFIGIFFILLYFVFASEIANAMVGLVSRLPYSTVTNHMISILKVISGENISSLAVDNRMEKISISVDTFINNPILGIRFAKINSTTVGFHQEWFDLLATQGILGALVFLIIIVNMHMNIWNNIKDVLDRKCYLFAVLFFVLLGFFDPCLSTSILVMVFVIAPNVSILFKQYK